MNQLTTFSFNTGYITIHISIHSHKLLQILNFDWLLNHGLFVIVHGWKNGNNKIAESFCFASVCTESVCKNRTSQEPKRLQNRV